MSKMGLRMGGVFTLTCRDKKTGKIKWVVDTHNIVTNEGLNHILNVYFHAATQVATWYLTLFESDSTPAAGSTYAVPGYTECTAYDETTRPEYNEAEAASQAISNSANRGQFTMNATKTIYGGAIVSLNTKGDTVGGGKLFAAGRFATAKPVADDDVLELQYSFSAADDGV